MAGEKSISSLTASHRALRGVPGEAGPLPAIFLPVCKLGALCLRCALLSTGVTQQPAPIMDSFP